MTLNYQMNLDTIRPRSERKDELLSITKNCETLIKQTQRKAEETLQFTLTQQRETFCFKLPTSIEGS